MEKSFLTPIGTAFSRVMGKESLTRAESWERTGRGDCKGSLSFQERLLSRGLGSREMVEAGGRQEIKEPFFQMRNTMHIFCVCANVNDQADQYK